MIVLEIRKANYPPPCVLATLLSFSSNKINLVYNKKSLKVELQSFNILLKNNFNIEIQTVLNSQCVFFIWEITQRISGYNLMRINPPRRSYSLIRNIDCVAGYHIAFKVLVVYVCFFFILDPLQNSAIVTSRCVQ